MTWAGLKAEGQGDTLETGRVHKAWGRSRSTNLARQKKYVSNKWINKTWNQELLSRGSTAIWSSCKKQGREGHKEWEAATAIWLDQPVRGWRGLEAKAAEGRERFLAGIWEEMPRESRGFLHLQLVLWLKKRGWWYERQTNNEKTEFPRAYQMALIKCLHYSSLCKGMSQ